MVDSNFILKNDLIRGYIKSADNYLNEIGFTEHGFAHVSVVANNASNILKELGYTEITSENAAEILDKIAEITTSRKV